MTRAERSVDAFALAILLIIVALGLVAPWLGYDPVRDVTPEIRDLGPSAGHWLGTDWLGRDVLLRMILATRPIVAGGALACGIGAAIGVPLGALAGFQGGLAESAIRYVFGVVGSVPRFVLVLLMLATWGDSLPLLAGAAGLSFAPIVGEAAYGRIAALRNREYVLASRAHGLSDMRILWVHLVWGASRRPIARSLCTLFGYYAVLESTLSYLGGFGVQEPAPSWGNMLVGAWTRGVDNWWVGIAPALALWALVAASTRVARALGDDEA